MNTKDREWPLFQEFWSSWRLRLKRIKDKFTETRCKNDLYASYVNRIFDIISCIRPIICGFCPAVVSR